MEDEGSQNHEPSRRSKDSPQPQQERPFTWTSQRVTPDVDNFDDFSSGINPGFLSEESGEIDFFEYFMDTYIVTQIVQYINQFHNYFVLNVNLKHHSRLQQWWDVGIAEFYIFLAVTMLMTRNKHLTLEEHWSTDLLLMSPIFSNIMKRNRYTTILGMLHFSAPNETSTSTSRLIKIQRIVDHARAKYQTVMTPYRNLCIDESIVPFKGRLIFKQYLPKKRNRFGIKLFVLCDVTTGIIVDFIVYCGASTQIIDPSNLGVGGAVVCTLLKEYFNTNRHLYIDNWYTSPKLLKFLHQNKIYACGTVKKNRAGMPTFSAKLGAGQTEVRYSPPLMALKWHDKKDIYMLSTIHGNTMGPSMREDRATGLPKMKPSCVFDYSNNMGSVDTADMLLSSLQCIRKTIKWYKKLFLHIVDMHLLNAFFTYKKVHSSPNLHFAQFQLQLIRQIIQKYNSHQVLERPLSNRNMNGNPLRILPANSAAHMPTLLDKRLKCKQCAFEKKRRDTKYTCVVCKVHLCPAPCFMKYHGNQ